jgi:hypothetical protein
MSLLFEVVCALLLTALVFFGVVALNAWQCEERWIGSGYTSKYTFATGCRIQRADGTWVPEKNLRDINLK